MDSQLSALLAPEREALASLRECIGRAGRASALVLAGYYRAHLDVMLHMLSDGANGRFIDLALPDQLQALQEAPPFYGRGLLGRLSDTGLRDFLSRSCLTPGTPLLAVHVPATIWKIVAASSIAAGGPGRFLAGLRQWSGASPLVISYPLEADASSLSPEELMELLGEQLVILLLRDVERRFLDGEEGLVDAEH